eukprot:UN20885
MPLSILSMVLSFLVVVLLTLKFLTRETLKDYSMEKVCELPFAHLKWCFEQMATRRQASPSQSMGTSLYSMCSSYINDNEFASNV